ncbi:PIN domain-containing protein [Leptolyngbya sp. FACHB-402]|nr:PIN domain-containing protein [Leptolyngbya sp. FACHB-161]MBD2377229.1 PIN domain-containing protein [Leptolyngbya sp. FACHB-238]MBD2401957.1 PIN domain-containing protein [Leptolyngbya sp. FACHB-239]MBD2408475.1 PIN domain-containing protein [Leptolyngbya sp. FACHB-402]
MRRTFLDAGVLIIAARGNTVDSALALNILSDTNREFVSGPFIQLEVLPKATYHKKRQELEFYEAYFATVAHWTVNLEKLLQDARQIASTYGLASIDALHIAAALSCNVDEFITTEKPTKPMYRVPNLNFVSI